MLKIPSPLPSKEIANNTDPSRDRVIDTLRALSLLVVVLGHIFMAIVIWTEAPIVGNILAGSFYLKALTWILQVMPIFFFAGGASNAISWRRRKDRDYSAWLWSRAARLLRPLWFYLSFMAPVSLVVAFITPTKTSAPLLLLSTQLLWFLGAYLVVTALAPLFIRFHDQNPYLPTFFLISLTFIADFARFYLDLPAWIGLINFVTVWSLAALLGVWYVDNLLNRKNALIFALSGLLINILLVYLGPYPLSMVGMPGESISNMAPPTLALLFHSIWLCAITVTISPLIKTLAYKLNFWRFVTAINLSAMTIYLWHLPVLILISVIERLLGLTAPYTIRNDLILPSAGYWSWWVIHSLVSILVIILIVRFLWILENAKYPLWDWPTRFKQVNPKLKYLISAFGVFLSGVGLLILAATGLAGFPFRVVTYSGLSLTSGMAILILVAGAALIRHAGATRKKINL